MSLTRALRNINVTKPRFFDRENRDFPLNANTLNVGEKMTQSEIKQLLFKQINS